MTNAIDTSVTIFSPKVNIPKVFLDNKSFNIPAQVSHPQSTKNNTLSNTTGSYRFRNFVVLFGKY